MSQTMFVCFGFGITAEIPKRQLDGIRRDQSAVKVNGLRAVWAVRNTDGSWVGWIDENDLKRFNRDRLPRAR